MPAGSSRMTVWTAMSVADPMSSLHIAAVRLGMGIAVQQQPSFLFAVLHCSAVALDKWSAQAASERGLVNVLLGNHCFTTAITALNKECSKLSNEQRCWLAIQFTMCFQRASGFKVGAAWCTATLITQLQAMVDSLERQWTACISHQYICNKAAGERKGGFCHGSCRGDCMCVRLVPVPA